MGNEGFGREISVRIFTLPSLLPRSWLGSATSYTAADIQGALLKQIRASKKKTILVKKPQQEHIRFMDFGESLRLYRVPLAWFRLSKCQGGSNPTQTHT